jgi:hypothetical protein
MKELQQRDRDMNFAYMVDEIAKLMDWAPWGGEHG